MEQATPYNRINTLNVKVDKGFDRIERRVNRVEAQITELSASVDEKLEKALAEFAAIRAEMRAGLDHLQSRNERAD